MLKNKNKYEILPGGFFCVILQLKGMGHSFAVMTSPKGRSLFSVAITWRCFITVYSNNRLLRFWVSRFSALIRPFLPCINEALVVPPALTTTSSSSSSSSSVAISPTNCRYTSPRGQTLATIPPHSNGGDGENDEVMEPRSTAKRKRPSCRRGTVVGLVTVLLLLGGSGGGAETVGPGAPADAAATSSSSAGANRRTVRAGGAAVAATTRWGRAVQGGDDGGDEGEAFASCADGREDHVCLHGGVCRPTVEDDQYRCDCSSAVDGDGTPHVGKWCHLPPQVLCDVGGGGGGGNDTDTNDTETNSTDNTNDDNTGLAGHFCVNDGTCNDDGPTCDCGEDFVGVHCEYRTGEDATTEADFQGGGSGGENTGGENTGGDNTDGDGGGGAQQQPPQGGQQLPPAVPERGHVWMGGRPLPGPPVRVPRGVRRGPLRTRGDHPLRDGRGGLPPRKRLRQDHGWGLRV